VSNWEEQKKRSVWYYACLILLLWPFFLFAVNSLLSVVFLGLDMLIPFLLSTAVMISLIFGCGARYRYRGINPASRNIINANDGHYFERIGADESDYP
jgi:hypothetical protein